MNDLISRFALEPYITPIPRETTGDYIPDATLDTLFPDLSMKPSEFGDLSQLLEAAEANLPIIYGLQSEKLSQPIPSDIDRGSISLFLSNLADTSIHLYSLCPVQKIDLLELPDLLSHCTQFRIAPDRAAWAVHFLVKKKKISEETLTAAFKQLLKPNDALASSKQEINTSHLAKFAYALYKRNLVNHTDIILTLIEALPPRCMSIFQNEIIQNFSLLYRVLDCNKKLQYKELLSIDLQTTRSQLVQLAFQDFPISNFVKDLQTDETDQRIKKLYDSLQPSRLTYFTDYRNLIFGSFPLLDSNVLAAHLSNRLVYATDDEKQELALFMCKSVLWFNSKDEAVAATIASLIKKLVPKFQVEEFFDLLLDLEINSEKYLNASSSSNNFYSDNQPNAYSTETNSNSKCKIIPKFKYLFYELQYQNLFTFSRFLYYIKTRGYKMNNKETLGYLISNLPSLDRSLRILNEIMGMLSVLIPDNNFDNQIREIGLNIIDKIDLVSKLPYIFKFQLALYLINQSQCEFSKMCTILQKLECLNLITILFNKQKPAKFIVYDVLFIEQTISCFISHDLLESVASIALNDNPNFEIAKFLTKYLKESEDNKIPTGLSKYKSQLSVKKQEKNATVNQKNIQKLMMKYSHLCSLHIFDCFYDVKTESDFGRVFCFFLKDLLTFPRLTYPMLLEFFIDFCEHQCITRGSYQFIRCFLQTVIENQELVKNENSNSQTVIINFLTHLFKAGFIRPFAYLHLVLSPKSRKYTSNSNSNSNPSSNSSNFNNNSRGSGISEPLITLFFKILDEHPNSFPVDSILNEKVIKNFTDLALFEQFLNKLRQFPTPIITESLRISLSKDVPSAVGAAYYSLLPFGLQTLDFNDAFEYFSENVDRTTSTFWTLWLRDKVCYNAGFPVTPKQVDKATLQDHIVQLCNCFSNLILSCDQNNEKLQIYLNCWTLLCSDDAIVVHVSKQVSNNIRNGKFTLRPMFIEYIQPIIHACSEVILEQICDGFCQYQDNIIASTNSDPTANIGGGGNLGCFELFTKTASSIFIVFADRFVTQKTQSTAVLMSIADKLLEWLRKMAISNSNISNANSNTNSTGGPASDSTTTSGDGSVIGATRIENRSTDTFVLDAFNFIVMKTSFLKLDLCIYFHEHIATMLEQLPQELRKFVIVNQPMQRFSPVPDPLYFDVTPPTVEDPTASLSFTGFMDDSGPGIPQQPIGEADNDFDDPFSWLESY
ncbi:hypothetical protein TRFO_01215 [Tritrichomonas foetus]|uniref:Uncharacterized protein n=1 Tax=Tritrichomonas foetus TaxID=1144522 RepID=A0A1J4KJX9_9EUKA|nr:hypothetical protein TRFO_01215 [Tritrichomonas foetus]|eukprot:OHT11248.1 hypothetical protein TRFO_01215 [Tritrichomonas foetus]